MKAKITTTVETISTYELDEDQVREIILKAFCLETGSLTHPQLEFNVSRDCFDGVTITTRTSNTHQKDIP